MIVENNDDLVLVNRILSWLDQSGMSVDYFLETLKEFGFSFPLRVSDFIESSNDSFSFLCSSSDTSDPISLWITMDSENSRIITFSRKSSEEFPYEVPEQMVYFWKQSVKI